MPTNGFAHRPVLSSPIVVRWLGSQPISGDDERDIAALYGNDHALVLSSHHINRMPSVEMGIEGRCIIGGRGGREIGCDRWNGISNGFFQRVAPSTTAWSRSGGLPFPVSSNSRERRMSIVASFQSRIRWARGSSQRSFHHATRSTKG